MQIDALRVLPRGAGSWSSGDGWSTSMGESSLWADWDSDMDCASDCTNPEATQGKKKTNGNVTFFKELISH